MKKIKRLIRVFCVAGVVSGLSSISFASPLFQSEEVLDVVVEAPMRELSAQRHENPEFVGTFRYTDDSGKDYELPVMVNTRGKTRLKVCDYPPLRITFDRHETAGTLFEGQHRLKLVTQCMRGNQARDWVHLESGAYQAYNAVTEYSFLVRKLNVTYRDSGPRGQRERVQPAFFIEDENDLSRRLKRRRIRPPRIESEQMDIAETTHNLLFQYLIGNTDFSVKRGPEGEGCCHNGRVFTEVGRRQEWIIVPYDFDYAGIINAEYAAPHESLPIRRVTTRLYRGFCWQNEELTRSVDLFNQKRTEIEAALLPPEISARKSRRVKNYLEQFFRIINDPEELQENLLDECRGPNTLPIRESAISPRFEK